MATTPHPHFGPTLYIDGGNRWRTSLTYEAQFSIGDGDSHQSRNLDELFPIEKDASDLSLGFAMLPSQTLQLWLWGFLGGDKAHELANFGVATHWLEGRPGSCAFFDNQLLMLSAGHWQLPLKHNFSLLSFVPNEITLTGDCRYTLKKPTALAALSSFGISNSGSGMVQINARRPLLVLGQPRLDEQILSHLVFCTARP